MSSEVVGIFNVVIKSDQERVIRCMVRNVVESLFENDFKQLCGCQVVMQHSAAGESAANGVTEKAIQTSGGQVRAIRSDWEMNIKAKLNPLKKFCLVAD